MNALQHRRDTFQAHAGINRWLRQGVHHTVFGAVELHKHIVPNFNKAVAIFLRASGRATPNMCAMIVENFGTWTAWAGIPHLPEVIAGIRCAFVIANADNFFCGDADFLMPNIVCLIVCGIDRHHQLIFRQI